MTARLLAAETLTEARTAAAWVGELLDARLRADPPPPAERRLATQLVFGVVRRRATLDALVRPFVQRPFHAVEPAVVDLLRLGAYQLAFLTHVPKHAAVHETVELARQVGRPMAKGFLNGVLRRVAELVTDDFVDKPAADAVPAESAGQYRRLTKPVLADPAADPGAYLAAGFSWPRWLADRWLGRHGPAEAFRLGFHFNAPPPLWLRVNKLKTDREGYRLQLAARGIDAEPGEAPQSLRVTDGVPVRDLPGYAEGEFTVQDHSSQLVAAALDPRPNGRVLDLCAAPGGKTTHLSELMRNRGTVVACDVDAGRLATVRQLCERTGVTNVELVELDRKAGEPPDGPFDAALVDAPCSNTGVLGRRPEARWRLRPDEFEDLIRLQTRLLLSALARVRPGGVIVYSTCSVEPEENRGVVDAVRRGMRSLAVEAEGVAVPGRPADGGYWARLRLPG